MLYYIVLSRLHYARRKTRTTRDIVIMYQCAKNTVSWTFFDRSGYMTCRVIYSTVNVKYYVVMGRVTEKNVIYRTIGFVRVIRTYNDYKMIWPKVFFFPPDWYIFLNSYYTLIFANTNHNHALRKSLLLFYLRSFTRTKECKITII